MAANNIPVSFDFFKKYTYHKECVDFMLKLKANGNQQTYEALLNNKESRERALRCYYEAFYFKPKIREKHHIRIKPIPKTMKDQLLQIPVQDASTSNENDKKEEKRDINKSTQDVINAFGCNNANVDDMEIKRRDPKNEPRGRTMIDKHDVCEDVCIVDDSEPLNFSDVTSTIQENEKVNSTTKTQKDKAIKDKEIPNTRVMEKDIDKENPKISSDVPHGNGNTAASDAGSKKQMFNYKALIPYIHCCPLTFNEFRKYSNIIALVREFCGKQKLDAVKQRMVLERSYILFYLSPEHRTITPINKIQLLDNCPAHIKDKFFSLPTRLYLKEPLNSNEPPKVVAKVETSMNKNRNSKNQQIVVAANTSTITEPHISAAIAVSQQKTATSVINNCNEENEKQQKTIPLVETTDKVNLTISCEKSKKTQHKVNSSESTQTTTTTITIAPNNPNKTNNNNVQQKSLQTLTTSITETPMNLPVSLDEFKKYTHNEEIVEKLFKIKAQDNEDLFFKYKSRQEACDATLRNFYHAFYLLPAIRNIWPIRFKPMPNFLKSRFLSIPEGANVIDFNNFKVEQLVPAITEIESPPAEHLPLPMPVEKNSIELHALNKANTCTESSQNPIGTISITENIIETSDSDSISNSPLGRIKRASNEIAESSAPKRQKTQQPQDSNSKKSYKDLLPYAHCCPITFSEFSKYTNISQLFTGYCKKRYNSVKKLPFMLQRAYILYYLAPENRNFKPFTKLKLLNECPLNLRDKIFEIPTNLYLKEEKIGLLEQGKMQTEIQTKVKMEMLEASLTHQDVTTNENKLSKTTDSHPKESIEILENRLLPPTTVLFSGQPSKESNHCTNNACVFYHISYLDFMKLTNILSIQPRPNEITDIKNTFKKFLYKLVKDQSCDEKYVINSALLCKLLKYKNICENCENDVQTLTNLDATTTSSVSESDRLSNTTAVTVVERCSAKSERHQSITETDAIADRARGNPVIDKSLIENQTESLANNIQTQHPITDKQSKDLLKHLTRPKIFSKFCQQLLSKLNQSYNGTVDFSSDCFKIFLECNDIPLTKILNDFCANNEDIVQHILNQSELYESLQRYYYYKYLTKYPDKGKQKPSLANCNRSQKSNTAVSDEKHNTVVTREVNQNSSNSEKTDQIKAANIFEINANNQTLNKEKSTNSYNAFEKAKRIFFRYVDKTHTLAYVLRISFGYKQAILRTVLTLTFEQFVEITNIYEGNELYSDTHIVECMYRYVFRTPLVWPTNLYITLKNLLKFLHKNGISFENYSTMLNYISPKLLHWSDLLSCTNFVDCVKIDFEKRTGKVLDTYDTKCLKHECIEYYNRCWKNEKWLGEIPLVDEEFCKNHLQDISQVNVAMLDGSSAPEACKVPEKDADNVEALNEDLVCVQSLCTAELNTSTKADIASKEFNCVLLPNTQQLIEMLPAENRVSNDPLDNCSNALDLNVSSSTSESFVSLGKLTQSIKAEPVEGKLLSNILFYEDDNSNIQCLACEEEIVCLDNTVETQAVEENLPPPQMDFEDSLEQRLYNVLMHSDDSNFVLNLAQHLPSSAESNNGTVCTQQFMRPSQTQLMQLPDVNLASSGENEDGENVPEKHLQNSKVAEPKEEENIPLKHDMGERFLNIFSEKYSEHQPFPTTLEATQIFSRNLSAEQANIPLRHELAGRETTEAVAEIIDAILAPIGEQQQQQINIVTKQIEPCTSKTIRPFAVCKNSCQSNMPQARLPLRQNITKNNAANKGTKNIATVKPLTKSGLVPQIQHNTRPLQTIPAYAAGSSNANQALAPAPEVSPPASVMLSLTPTSNSSSSTGQSTQNSSFQLQLSNLGAQIYISQELNTNCSVFDNSSLLRIVDHNYYKPNTTNSDNKNKEAPGSSSTIEEQQSNRIITHNISICPDNNSFANSGRSQNDNEQSDNTNEQAVRRVTQENTICPHSSTEANTNNTSNNLLTISTTTDNQQECCPRLVTSNTSNVYDINDKVNNSDLKNHTNNIVTAITVIIHQPTPQYFHKMIRKICLYRELIKFHYFKELTTQHISEYLLPSSEIGKSYTEALIACENFKTRISNRSISALFPFWSQSIQRDFLLVLDDLKEFHYTVYDRVSMRKKEDLRVRILFWLLNTAPSFSLCHFIYDVNNSEFSYCESIQNGNNSSYQRKPFKCLTSALSPKFLGKLREIKKDLNSK